MIQIIKKIIIVLAVIVIIDKIFTYAFMHLIFSKTISGESGGTINYVLNKKSDIDFLIIGPSRAKHGMDPAELSTLGKNGYDLGINGTDVLNSLLVLDILIKHNVKPKTIVLQTDLSDYTGDSKTKILDQIKRVYPYNTELVREYVSRVGYVEQMKYFFGTYRLNRKVANIGYNFLKRDSIGDNNGFVGLPSIPFAPDEKSLSTNYVYDKNSTTAEALRRIKKICDDNNIKFVVVFPPSYKNVFYNGEQQKVMLEDLKRNGINNVIDLSDISKLHELAKEENWRDAIHFNTLGAETFSKILNRELAKTIK